MDEREVAWPMGLSDHDPSLADRPLAFNPKGFLVAILENDDHAEQAGRRCGRLGSPIATCGSTPASKSWPTTSGISPNAASPGRW
jgi:hypothetical protein